MLKLNNVFRFILTIIIFSGSFYYFSEPERINNLSGWLHLIIGGGVLTPLEGANKQVISSQADSLIKISRIWADFFPANTSNQPI